MQLIIGWLLIFFPGALLIAQLISSLNFEFAQKLGIQENPEESDGILQRAERYVAYWDLVTLVWLPLAGLLMVINHPLWPYVALIGGAIYFDASGREAAKNLSLKHEVFKIGTPQQQKVFFASYVIMVVIGVGIVGYALAALL
jgi:hypothetical protein